MKDFQSLVGEKFGKLTVISGTKNNKQNKRMWVCVCDCGKVKEKPVTTYDLKAGKVKSCGCLYLESNKGINKKHGMTGTRIYQSWYSMKQRCLYPRNVEFKNYGGRGIKVCDEWLNNFQAFYDWAMSNGYNDTLTLDRINVNDDYKPSNCRWVTMKQQQNNRRNNKRLIYENKSYTIAELANKLKISPATLQWRLKNGWGLTDIALQPSYKNKMIRRKTV